MPQQLAPGLENIIARDTATLGIAQSISWGLQPLTATAPFRAGIWPRMDGNRYSNQPDVGLAAQTAAARRQQQE